MAKASLTIAIGGEYQGKDAIRKAESDLKALRESARQAGGGAADIMKIGDSMVDIGSAIEVGGAKITDFGGKLTKLTAPIGAVGLAAVKLAADFEDSVAKVYTIMDKSVMSTEDMSQTILDLSTDTGKSATELADATYQALSASVATKDVAGFVKDAVKLSKAGFTSTTTAVDTLTTIINAYGYSAEDAEEISNKLIQTQNKGKTTVDELGQSLGNVIPTAAAYGVNLDNVASAYVVMTKQGINTANATTALNGMMTELADDASDVNIGLQEMTGKTFKGLMDEGWSLGDVLQLLSDACGNDSEEFANLWGNVRAGKGALAIANAGSAEFNATLEDMANSGGLVDSALEDLQTPTAKLNKAINALKNTSIELGEEVLDAAMPMIDGIVKGAKDLYKWFDGLDKETKQNAVRMGALAAAAGPVLMVLGKMTTAVGGLVSGFGKGLQKVGSFVGAMQTTEREMLNAGATTVTLGDKMKGAASKTGLLTKASGLLKGGLAAIGIAAAVAAVGLIVDAYTKWKEHNDKVKKATEGLENALGTAKTAYDSYAKSVDAAAESMGKSVVSAEEALTAQADLADKMGDAFKDVGKNAAVIDSYAKVIEDLGGKGELTKDELAKLKWAVDGFNQETGAGIEITDEMTGALNRSKESILRVAEAYKEEAKQAAVREMMTEVNKQLITDELALEQAKEKLKKAEADYQKALKEYPEYAQSYLDAVNDAQREVDELSASQQSAEKTLDKLTSMAASSPKRFQTMEEALASCGESIEGLGDVTDEQLAAIEGAFDGSLASIVEACKEQGVAIPAGLAQGIEEKKTFLLDTVKSQAGSVIEKYRSIFETHSPSKVMERIGADLDTGLAQGVSGSTSKPKKAMADLASAIKGAVAGLPDAMKASGASASGKFASGINDGKSAASDAAKAVNQKASAGFDSNQNSFRYAGRDVASSFDEGIKDYKDNAWTVGKNNAISAKNGISDVSAYTTGQNFMTGFGNGMGNVDVWTAAYNIGISALSAIKKALGIKSPSKEAMQVGQYFGEGAIIGMQNTERALTAESRRLSDMMTLEPTADGSWAAPWAATASFGASSRRDVRIEVNVYPQAGATPAEIGKMTGREIAEAMYTEITRQEASALWL